MANPSAPTAPSAPAIPTDSLAETLDIINQEQKEWESLNAADKWEKLENIWGDIWVTPLNGDGIDPLDDPSDCVLWPGHMACSDGSKLPDKNAWGFSFDIDYDGCSVCLTVTPVLGFVKLTPYTICYRWCEEDSKDGPPHTPIFRDPTHPSAPPNREWPIRDYERLIYFLKDGAEIINFGTTFNEDGSILDRENENWNDTSNIDLNNYNFVRRYANDGFTRLDPPFYAYLYSYPDGTSFVVRVPAKWQLKTFTVIYENGSNKQVIPYLVTDTGEEISCYWNPIDRIGAVPVTTGIEPNFYSTWDQFLTTKKIPIDPVWGTYYTIPWLRTLFYTLNVTEQPIPLRNPPPPPPPPDPQKDMNNQSCCDLRPILKEIAQTRKDIKDLKKSLGTPNAGYVPKGQKVEQVKFNSLGEGINKLSKDFAQMHADFHRVIRPDEFGKSGGVLGFGQSNKCFIPKDFILPNVEGEEKIENYQELALNIFKMIDRYVGAPKRVIKIKDADPNKPGDQSVSITSETLGDILQNIMQFLVDKSTDDSKSDGLYLQFLTKILYQDGISYKNIQWLYLAMQEIIQGLGIGVGEKKQSIPMLFNYSPKLPNTQKFTEEQLDNFYNDFVNKTKNLQITVPYLKDDARSLVSYLVEINKNSGVAAASLGKNVSSRRGLETLVRAAYLSERLGSLIMSRAANQPNNIGDLKDFLQDAEKQYKEQSTGDTIVTPIEVEDNKFYGQLKKPKISKRKSRRNRK